VDRLVVALAQGGIVLVAVGALVTWLLTPRSAKAALLAQGLVTVLVVAVLVRVAGTVHADPRPFVVHPALRPLFRHAADNGFPSDHTALATGVVLVVARHRRRVGLGLLVLAVAIGVARVAAHVHHVEDVVAGLVIGAAAAMVGLALGGLVSAPLAPLFLRHRGAQRDPGVTPRPPITEGEAGRLHR
jgi:undecaprenyl-diphosphatase